MKSKKMQHIAIDPSMLGAKKPKPCVVYAGIGVLTGWMHIDDLLHVDSYIGRISANGYDTVIIEDGYCGFPKQSIGLAEARRRLEDAALRQGLTVHRLPVTMWQAGMLGKKRKGKCKEISKQVASELVGREVIDDNEADAINMYFFVADNPNFWEW